MRSAADPVPARVTRQPARDLLEHIVAADRRADTVTAPARLPRRRLRPAVVGVAGALAAAVAATLAVVNTGPASAAWTAEPSPLPADEAHRIARACVPAPERDAARVIIGETRGDYAYVNTATPGWSRTCFRDHDGQVRESSILAGPLSTAQLGARGVELSSWGQLRTEEGYVRLMAGGLGAQVTGVDITVRPADGGAGRTIRATVRDNHFAAWYPEGIEESSTNRTVLSLRLADGTVSDVSARDLMAEAKVD